MTTRTLTQDDVDAFGLVSGATGLIHTEPTYAATTRFGATLVPGILLTAMVAQELPPGWTTLNLAFVAPVRVGTPFEIVLGPDKGDLAIEVRTPDGVAVSGSATRPW